ncbi:MAG: PepSY-associated TM helix domain-containing protein [Alphaproteobacteria bacterium]
MTKEPTGKGATLRLIRDWHGYLSALSFLVLLFFAATGVLLNHPNMLPGPGVPYQEKVYYLSPADLARVNGARDKSRTFFDIVSHQLPLAGRYDGGGLMSGALVVRTEGVRGTSDLELNLITGQTQVNVSRRNALAVLNGLHMAETAGAAWKYVVDVAAVLLIAMSILGYVLFLLLRFRLRTALILTGLCLAGFFAAFLLLAT